MSHLSLIASPVELPVTSSPDREDAGISSIQPAPDVIPGRTLLTGDLVALNTQQVNCRAWMSTIAPVRRLLKKNEHATLLSDPIRVERQTWVKVRMAKDGIEGYLAARYVDLVEDQLPCAPTAPIADTAIDPPERYQTGDFLTLTGSTNVRLGPGIHHPIVHKTGGNVLGIVLDEPSFHDADAWVLVRFPAGSGWVVAHRTIFFAREEKWIEVDLSSQILTAWLDATAISSSPISSGKPGFPTPHGVFSISTKIPTRRLRGSVNGEDWDIPGVPWIMIFRQSGFYIHAAYWHDNFGQPASHGCVTLPVPYAEWLYDWTPSGTPIWIHY